VLLVNLLAVLNFANVFFKIKKRLKNKKTLKRDQNKKKRKRTFFTSMDRATFSQKFCRLLHNSVGKFYKKSRTNRSNGVRGLQSTNA